MVILDETRALVANFNSDTLWKNEKVNALENIKTLAWLVGKSSYVIAACADGRYDGGFNALVRGVAGTRRIVVWDVLGKKLVRSLKVQYTGGSPGNKSIVIVHFSAQGGPGGPPRVARGAEVFCGGAANRQKKHINATR